MRKFRRRYISPQIADYVQTFRVDPDLVGNAEEILLTSVELFFKNKPQKNTNISGSSNPGVVISICQTKESGSPHPIFVLENSVARASWDEVFSFSDASIPTVFKFAKPVKISSQTDYGLVVRFENPEYELWTNVIGDVLVGETTKVSTGVQGKGKTGKLYKKSNDSLLNPVLNTHLKYIVNGARVDTNSSSNSGTFELVNRPYEFLKISGITGRFRGDEKVYFNVSVAGGTITITAGNTEITGSGTTFTNIVEGDHIVAVSGSTEQIIRIQKVTNTTHMVAQTVPSISNTSANWKIAAVGEVYYTDYIKNKLYLVNSSANSTVKFVAGGNVVGPISGATANVSNIEILTADEIIPRIRINRPHHTHIDIKHYFGSYSNGSSYIVDADTSKYYTVRIHGRNRIRIRGGGRILSRSLEVLEANLYSTDRRSGVILITANLTSNSSGYSIPQVDPDEADVFIRNYQISNTYMNGVYDSEVFKNGLALSKGIEKKVAFANNRFAEDLRVYLTGYRPEGTDIRVYAKLHNSNDPETFDDKLWTPLRLVQNGDKYSASDDKDDLIEYEYGLQKYPDTANTLPGSFTTQLSNTIITASGVDPTTYVVANDLIKIYNPLIQENYMVVPVASANSTSITLATAVANNNVVGSGFVVDKLLYTGTAFTNQLNGNVCRYFTSTLVPVDRFNSMQLKIVHLADDTKLVPEVDSVEAIGVNAGAV